MQNDASRSLNNSASKLSMCNNHMWIKCQGDEASNHFSQKVARDYGYIIIISLNYFIQKFVQFTVVYLCCTGETIVRLM